MKQSYQRKILGTADKQFDSGEVTRVQSEGSGAIRDGHQAATPTARQGLKNRVSEDISMIAMAAEVSTIFAQGFFEHQASEFIKWLRTEIRIVSGGEG